ncbi:MAG: hypothetical protein ACKOTD_03570 [Phycisphaerales bacterium]
MNVARIIVHAVAGAVALSAAACVSTEKVPAADPSVMGAWRSLGDRSTISFAEGGLYSLLVKGQSRAVVGGWSYDPGARRLTLSTRRESPLCADDQAVYELRIGSLRMDADPVREGCDARRAVFAQSFERVGGGRNTDGTLRLDR